MLQIKVVNTNKQLVSLINTLHQPEQFSEQLAIDTLKVVGLDTGFVSAIKPAGADSKKRLINWDTYFVYKNRVYVGGGQDIFNIFEYNIFDDLDVQYFGEIDCGMDGSYVVVELDTVPYIINRTGVDIHIGVDELPYGTSCKYQFVGDNWYDEDVYCYPGAKPIDVTLQNTANKLRFLTWWVCQQYFQFE